jgi:hypothetical protein
MNRSLLRAAAVFLLYCAWLAVDANPVGLSGVTFTGGSTATGSFVLRTATRETF